jgi:hypothetical protein
MSLSSLSAKTDYTYDGQAYSRGRRAPLDNPDPSESKVAPPIVYENPPPAQPFDLAFYASRFKADLSQLKAFSKNDEDFPPGNAADADGDRVLYDFFGNLSVLLVSVRAGNLERARAAADALELEVMVESSAGARGPGRLNMLDDLRHLLNAAQSGDETAARAAAQDLARDVKQSLDKPRGHPAPDPAATPGEPDLDATAAAYDALMAYIGGDAQSAA